MKNFFVTTVLMMAINIVSAQTKIGIKAGWNYSTAKIVENSINQKTQYVSGYNAGIIFKVPFDGAIHFSPAINFTHKGYSYAPASGALKKTENHVNSIDLVPFLSVDFATSKKSAFIIGFSPVLSIAISGKEKNTFPNDSVSTTKMLFNYYNYSKFDIGLTGSIGYKFNKIILEASYFYGLANVENDESLLRNIQNRMFSVTLGYYLK